MQLRISVMCKLICLNSVEVVFHRIRKNLESRRFKFESYFNNMPTLTFVSKSHLKTAINISMCLCVFKNLGESMSREWGRGRGKSRLPMSREPQLRAPSQNQEIMTWAEVRCSTDWATQAAPYHSMVLINMTTIISLWLCNSYVIFLSAHSLSLPFTTHTHPGKNTFLYSCFSEKIMGYFALVRAVIFLYSTVRSTVHKNTSTSGTVDWVPYFSLKFSGILIGVYGFYSSSLRHLDEAIYSTKWNCGSRQVIC